MKIKFTLLLFLIASAFSLQAQETKNGPDYVGEATLIAVTPSLDSKRSELTPGTTKGEAKDGRYSKIRRPKREVVPGKGLEVDYFSQNQHPLQGKVQASAVTEVWDAGYTGSQPTDPALAVGPDHVFVVWNTAFAIFDKDGNELLGDTNPVGAIFPQGGCCDLTVSYDSAADRWVISFLGDGVQVAVSETGNPLTTDWNVYNIPAVNDYNKLSIWSDGYYLTDVPGPGSNTRLYAMDRSAMLTGNLTASVQGFALPGISTFGFASPQVLNVTDDNMPALGNTPIVFHQDNIYPGVTSDHIKFWTANVDYTTPSNSNVSAPQEIPVTPFTSVFDGGGFDNLDQPVNGFRLDALQGIIMNQAQFRKFPTYNAAVFNHVIDTDNTGGKRAAIRWYEFRQANDGAPWTLFQEGTYESPNNKHAWNASIMMDNQGNIGMGYTAMSIDGQGTTQVSSYYTGRFATDPLNTMTIAEETIVIGDGNIPGGSNQFGTRYGDYSKIDIDPIDDQTFYFTNEVHTEDTPINQRAANVGRFKLTPDVNNDTGIIAILQPENGSLTATETVEVVIRNFGLDPQSNIPVSFSIDNGAPVVEVFAGTIQPGTNVNYTFTATANLNTTGQTYTITASTNLIGDDVPENDDDTKIVTHLDDNDTGVLNILSPVSGSGLTTMENVTVDIRNYGGTTQTTIPVFYSVNNGTPIMETYNGSIAPQSNDTYTFTTPVDLSALDDYTLVVGTALPDDADESNDDLTVTISNSLCQPQGNCADDDGVTQLQLADQDIDTNCDAGGYTDDTDIVFNFILNDNPFDGTVRSGFNGNNYAIWIDFDDSNSFEASELIANGAIPTANTDVNFTVDFGQISGVATGMHRMRVRGEFEATAGDVLDPCGDVAFGRTNDYTANVTGVLGVEDTAFANANLTISSTDSKIFELALNTTEFTEAMPVTIYSTLGQNLAYYVLDNNGSGYNKTIDMSYVSTGVYFVKVGTDAQNRVQRIIVK